MWYNTQAIFFHRTVLRQQGSIEIKGLGYFGFVIEAFAQKIIHHGAYHVSNELCPPMACYSRVIIIFQGTSVLESLLAKEASSNLTHNHRANS